MTQVSSSARTAAAKRDETPFLGRLVGGLQSYMATRQTRRLLRDLDDHMLRDIGLTPADLEHVPHDRLLQRARNFP